MKRCKKIRKLVVTCLSMFILLLPIGGTVSAVSNKSQNVTAPDIIKEWDNGANVTKTSIGTGTNFQTSIKADTNGLKKGYYTVYLYDISSHCVNSDDGVRFNFRNLNNQEIKINLTLTVNSKTNVAMTDSSYAILEFADQSFREAVTPAYGTISIPANFDGTVYIPFSKLFNTDGKHVSLTDIKSYGVAAIMTQNQQIQYQLGNIEFLSGSIASMRNCYLIYLLGKNNIDIPYNGSILENYQYQIKDLNGNPVQKTAAFFLKNNVAGAAITKDGNLEVSSGCTASDITICSKLPDSIDCAELTVSLKRENAGKFVGIPRPSDTPKITTAVDTKLDKFINIIRFAAVAIASIIWLIFQEWFSESNANFNKIKNELYHLDDNEEVDKP